MSEKKLLMIVNPRAGRSKPRGPLYDAAAAFCDAGYTLCIRRTAAAGDARRIAENEGGGYDTVVGTVRSTRSSPVCKYWKNSLLWAICLKGAPTISPPA